MLAFLYRGQAITFCFTQRMLRKGEQSILAKVGRQVHEIIIHAGFVFAFQWNEQVVGIERDIVCNREQSTDAFAVQGHFQGAVYEEI